MIRIYLDDLRPVPDGWVGATNYKEAIELIENNEWSEISLDHDLGDFTMGRELTGYDVLMHIVNRKMDGAQTGLVWVHTANPVMRIKMEDVIRHYKINLE